MCGLVNDDDLYLYFKWLFCSAKNQITNCLKDERLTTLKYVKLKSIDTAIVLFCIFYFFIFSVVWKLYNM